MSARVYLQNGQCFNDFEPPTAGVPSRVVRGGEARQLELEEDEVTGIDPHLGSKLRPGEYFTAADLQKKYSRDLKPLLRLTGAECQALGGAQQPPAMPHPASGGSKPRN